MKFTKPEKVVLIILSGLLVAGGERVYIKRSRSFQKIVIARGGIKEELTLKEVERRLKESRKIDINTADADEIASVPGIGEILAARIIEYRDTCGGFNSRDDLLKVPGIGVKKLEGMGEYLKLET
jgi:competence protein ComEA